MRIQPRTWEPRPPVTLPRQESPTKLQGKCFVIDGDTITMGKTSIRLSGIDAPEMDQPYGKKAKWELATLCKDQMITAIVEGVDDHGRTVAACYLPDGRDLSAEMVKLGMALDWKKHSGGKYRQYETADARKRLWRVDARQKGRFPPTK